MKDDPTPTSFVEVTDTFEVTSSVDDGFDYHCESCGVGLVYAGRGRKPRFCDDHKKGSKTQSGNPQSKSGGKQDQTIKDALTSMYGIIGVIVASPMVPVLTEHDGMLIGASAENLADSWITASHSNPSLRKTLIKLTQQSGFAAVVASHVAVGFMIYQAHRVVEVE